MLSVISQGDKDQYRMLTYGIKKHQLKKKKDEICGYWNQRAG